MFSLHTVRLTPARHRVSLRQSLTLLIFPPNFQTLVFIQLERFIYPNGPVIFPNCSFPHAPKLQFSKHCPGSQRQQHLSTYCKCALLGPRAPAAEEVLAEVRIYQPRLPRGLILFVLTDTDPPVSLPTVSNYDLWTFTNLNDDVGRRDIYIN